MCCSSWGRGLAMLPRLEGSGYSQAQCGTDQQGNFDLLHFRPGLLHPSIGHLVVPCCWDVPCGRSQSALDPRSPELKRISRVSLRSSRVCYKQKSHQACSVLSINCVIQMYTLLLLLSHFSRVRLSETPEMAAHQAPPSLGFSRQEHWSGLPFPSPMYTLVSLKSSKSQMPFYQKGIEAQRGK